MDMHLIKKKGRGWGGVVWFVTGCPCSLLTRGFSGVLTFWHLFGLPWIKPPSILSAPGNFFFIFSKSTAIFLQLTDWSRDLWAYVKVFSQPNLLESNNTSCQLALCYLKDSTLDEWKRLEDWNRDPPCIPIGILIPCTKSTYSFCEFVKKKYTVLSVW